MQDTIPLTPSAGCICFLGVLGAGMAPLAALAAELGFCVVGYDRRATEQASPLSPNIPVLGEDAPLPADTALVVYSLAISPEHPGRREASHRAIPALSRPAFLGWIERRFPVRLAVSGMHGKSSTVGMCAEILAAAGLAPTVLAGADLGGGGYRQGRGDILLYEACEYRDAFLCLSPTHLLILNTEWEHTDYFADGEAVLASFRRLAGGDSVKECVVSTTSPLAREGAPVLFGAEGTYQARAIGARRGRYAFTLFCGETALCRVSLSVLGRFQVENALAAAALCHRLGASPEAIAQGLGRFHGVRGRMERLGRVGRAQVYLDYAHHPTELSAALAAAAEVSPRVRCIFEGHTYSRVHAFRATFAAVLRRAEAVGILPIFAAREQNTYGVSGEMMAKDARAAFLRDYAEAAELVGQWGETEGVILLIGAGGIGAVADILRKQNVLN